MLRTIHLCVLSNNHCCTVDWDVHTNPRRLATNRLPLLLHGFKCTSKSTKLSNLSAWFGTVEDFYQATIYYFITRQYQATIAALWIQIYIQIWGLSNLPLLHHGFKCTFKSTEVSNLSSWVRIVEESHQATIHYSIPRRSVDVMFNLYQFIFKQPLLHFQDNQLMSCSIYICVLSSNHCWTVDSVVHLNPQSWTAY